MSTEFDDLDALAHRIDAEQNGTAAMEAARIDLCYQSDPENGFLTTVLFGLEPRVDWDEPTANTDGKYLGWNPDYFLSLLPIKRRGLLKHETLHVANLHHIRIVPLLAGGADPQDVQDGADLSINQHIPDEELWDGALKPGRGAHTDVPAGLSLEEYVALLTARRQQEQDKRSGAPDQQQGGDQQGGSDPQQQQSGQGSGQPDPNQQGQGAGSGQPDPQQGAGQGGGAPQQPGSVRAPSNDPGELQEAAQDAQVTLAQAALVAQQAAERGCGDMPAYIRRLIEEQLAPEQDYRDVLRPFVEQHAADAYRWSPPSRRFIAAGMILPTLRSESIGDIVCAIDLSASVSVEEANRYAAEVQGVAEAYPCRLHVIIHNHEVIDVLHWEPGQPPLEIDHEAGGGTNHHPVFEWIEQQDFTPVCFMGFTDLESRFPTDAPDYPVMWFATGTRREAPFGDVTPINP